MSNFLVFLRKEIMELVRTKKLLGLAAVFLFFAFTSPVLARYMTEFIALLVPADEALQFLIPDPVWTDSYAQFYGNIAQIGTITIILLFMGVITSERQRGTADLVLTKGLSHWSFVCSKFAVISAAIKLTMLASIGVVFLYTFILFDTAGSALHVFLGACVYIIFLLLVAALTVFASAIAKSNVIAAMIGFFGFLFILLVSAIPRAGDLLPGNLSARAMEITVDGYFHSHLIWNLLISLGLTILLLLLTIWVLRRQEGE
ncbi:MAG: ABC transporter permease [Oscillospiraceae bacterium]|nr:ABC transporter permease [Oscillospiraceae bacterium]